MDRDSTQQYKTSLGGSQAAGSTTRCTLSSTPFRRRLPLTVARLELGVQKNPRLHFRPGLPSHTIPLVSEDEGSELAKRFADAIPDNQLSVSGVIELLVWNGH